MTAADLREVVTLRLPVVGTDETVTYTTLETDVPAAVQAESARQVVAGAHEGSQLTYRVTLRYRTDLGCFHQLLWGTRVLRIVGVWDLDGMRHWLALRCVESAPTP